MYSNKNYTTLSAVGLGKNIAAGHPELLFTETSKYFFCLQTFWNGPAKSCKNSSFGHFASGNFPNSFKLFTHLRFLPAFWQSEQFLAFSTISRWILGHHTSDASRNMASLPACPKCMAPNKFSRISFGITSRWSMYSIFFESRLNELNFSLQGGNKRETTAGFLSFLSLIRRMIFRMFRLFS